MAIGKNIKGITIEFNGDTTKLGKALSDTDKKTRSLDQQLRQVDRDLKFNPGNTELLAQKQKLLGDKVKETRTRLEALKDAQAKLDDDPAVDKTSQDYMALRREIIETESKLKHFEGQMKELDNIKFEKVGRQVQNVGNKMKSVGDGMSTYVTAPIVAGAGLAVKAWEEVDNGLDIVTQKTGATGKALGEMQTSVKNLTQEIPTDFETAGAAVGEVNTRFGLTGKALEDLSGKFIKFAQLNGTDVSSSIDAVQKAMAAYGIEAKDAGNYLDVLNKVGQDTGVNVDTLAESVTANAGALKQMGLNSTQAAFFVGQLEKSGIDSSTALGGLQKALANGAKDGKSMAEVLADVQTKIVGAGSDTEAAAAAMEIFGAKAGPKMAEALRSGALDFEALATSATDAAGSVDKTFEETLDPADKFKLMMNSLKTTGYEVANTMFTSLAPAIEKLANWLKDLSTKWAELSPNTQMFILKMAGLLAVVGPVLSIIGRLTMGLGGLITMAPKIIGGFKAIGGAFKALGAVLSANPWVLITAAAIAAIVLIYKNWDKIKEFFAKLWEAIKVVAKAAWEGIKNMFKAVFEAIKLVITTYVNIWKKIITTVFNALKTYFMTIFNIYKKIFKTAFNIIKDYIVTPIKDAKDKVTEIIGGLKDKFSEIFDSIKQKAADKFKAIKDAIIGPIKTARDKIKEIIDKIKGFFDFDFKLPHIKLPHFSISPPGWQFSDLLEGSIPSLGIDWYAKGGIFKSPSLIGVGEAGHEGVIPLDPFWAKMDAIRESAAIDYDLLAQAVARAMANVQIQTEVAIDGKAVGQAVTPTVNRALQNRGVLDGRYA